MHFARNTLLKYFIAVLCSFYITLILNAQIHLPDLYFLLSGLIFCVLIFHLLDSLTNNFPGELFNKRIALISAGIAALLLVALPRATNPSFEPDQYALIKITALGQKNDSAKASEIWITHISNSGIEHNLNTFPLDSGWEEKPTAIVSYQKQPNTFSIKIEDPVHPQVSFTMHPWSGKVKIEEGKKATIVDLYKNAAGTYVYTSNSAVAQKKRFSVAGKITFTIISFLALAMLVYICLLYSKVKKNFFLVSIPLCFFLFFPAEYVILTMPQKLLLLLLSLVSCFVMQKPRAGEFVISYTKSNRILTLLVFLYAGFAFIGQRLFLADYPITKLAAKIAYFILFSGFVSLMGLLFLYITDWCKTKFAASKKNHATSPGYSNVQLYLIFLGILLACWSVYLFAFFPGNMSPDSLDQWKQATGMLKTNDAHPVFHTLIIKLLLSIDRTPAIITISQILALAAVCASFLVYLYKAGIPLKWLIVFALLTGIAPANGILSVILWKDLLFCCSILWLTLLFSEFATDIYIFNYKTTVIFLPFGLIAVALFRHNGTPAAVLASVILIYWAIKKRKKPIAISAAIFLVVLFAYKQSIPHITRPMPSGYQNAGFIHGIASVIYYDGDLTPETRQEMLKVLPENAWKQFYSPFSADDYLFHSQTLFIDNISKIPTSKVLSFYGSAFLHNPYLITKDRLCGSELLWDVFQANGSFDYMYTTEIDENELGITQSKNSLHPLLKQFLDYTAENDETILWRAGLYNVLLAFLFLMLVKERKQYFLILLPLIANNLSLLISMSHQSFRYVYFVPLTFGFIWLLTMSKSILPVNYKKA